MYEVFLNILLPLMCSASKLCSHYEDDTGHSTAQHTTPSTITTQNTQNTEVSIFTVIIKIMSNLNGP